MTHVYEADTADLVWRAAAAKFGEADVADLQPGRGGPTLEHLHAAFTIREPRQRWVVSRRPAINPAFAIAEVIWILNGRNDAAFLNHWFPGLPRYTGGGARYHAAYGHRLRKGFGFDQLERAYNALRNNPDSRQIVLQIWNPQTDFPDHEGKPVAADIPCNICAFPKIRNNRLEWLQVMRSNDLQRGLPYNFIQFTTLQEVMAGWLGVGLGSYNHISDSLHVYEREAADVRAFTPVEGARNDDPLCLGWTESGAAFGEMSRLLDVIISPGLSQKDLLALVTSPVLPRPYHNLLLVVAAEGARRRGWGQTADELMADCSNPALAQAWGNWIARCRAQQRPA